MTSFCLLPDFSIDRVQQAIQSLYGISGRIKQLTGERDLNFLIETDAQKFVFKISNAGESLEFITAQIEVLNYLDENTQGLVIPICIKSVNGGFVVRLHDENGRYHLCRLVKFVEGDILSEFRFYDKTLLQSLGQQLAKIHRCLAGFKNSGLERRFLWDIQHAIPIVEKNFAYITDNQQRQLIIDFKSRFQYRVLPFVDQLPRSIIHNDANDNNVVVQRVDQKSSKRHVVGLIDFGDMLESWRVVDLAVACAYALLHNEKPVDVACMVVVGYHEKLGLQDMEFQVLYEFICMRLCMSVVNSAYQKSLQPDNAYLTISEKPAWQALFRLRKISPDFAHFSFREACGLEPILDSAR